MMIIEDRLSNCEERLIVHTHEIWNTTHLTEENRTELTYMRDGLYRDTGINY